MTSRSPSTFVNISNSLDDCIYFTIYFFYTFLKILFFFLFFISAAAAVSRLLCWQFLILSSSRLYLSSSGFFSFTRSDTILLMISRNSCDILPSFFSSEKIYFLFSTYLFLKFYLFLKSVFPPACLYLIVHNKKGASVLQFASTNTPFSSVL